MGIPPAQPQLQLMERGICSPVQPWPFGAFFSLPWAGAGIPGDWRSPSKRRNCRTQGNKDRERALCDPACLQSSAVLQLPREESQMERLAEAGAAGAAPAQPGINSSFPEPLLQLFSPLCPKGETKKLCQGHSELPGNQGCLPWSSCKEEIKIREQHPHRISPASGCTKENPRSEGWRALPTPRAAADPDS